MKRLVFATLVPESFNDPLGNRRGQNLQRRAGERALYLRSVCWITTALRGLSCHPLTCILLKLRLSADSIPFRAHQNLQ